jgi:hypothetical protein
VDPAIRGQNGGKVVHFCLAAVEARPRRQQRTTTGTRPAGHLHHLVALWGLFLSGPSRVSTTCVSASASRPIASAASRAGDLRSRFNFPMAP